MQAYLHGDKLNNKTPISKHFDVSFLNDNFPTFSQTLLKEYL